MKGVRQSNTRLNGHIIALASGVLDVVQQIFGKKAFSCRTAYLVEIEIRPAGLLVGSKRIKIRDHTSPIIEAQLDLE